MSDIFQMQREAQRAYCKARSAKRSGDQLSAAKVSLAAREMLPEFNRIVANFREDLRTAKAELERMNNG